MLTLDQLDSFIASAESAGWAVTRRAAPHHVSLPVLANRYGNIPADYAFFLSHLTECVNAEQNAWFLTERDYNAVDVVENTFRWNEWELLSLGACEDDIELARKTTDFWRRHLPIMSAVHSDYAYIAIRVDDGVIVYGYSSDFEEPEIVCNSLSDYLSSLGDILSGRKSVELISTTGEVTIERAYSDFM